MTGDEIRAARERAGLTQEQVANRLGVTQRTVGNWERGATVPRNRLAAVGSLLGIGQDDAVGLRSASDAELLAEIARRFARGREDGGEHVRSASTSNELTVTDSDVTIDRPEEGDDQPRPPPPRRARKK